MKKDKSFRIFQFNESVKRNLAILLRNESIFDEFNSLISISNVVSSRDFRVIKIYFRCDPKYSIEFEEKLNKLSKKIAFLLNNKAMGSKYVPELRFFYDNSIEISDEIGKLLDLVK